MALFLAQLGMGKGRGSPVVISSTPVTQLQSAAGSGAPVAFTGAVSVGQILCVGFQWRNSTAVTLTGATDQLGNTYALVPASAGTGTGGTTFVMGTQFAYCISGFSGTPTITPTWSTGPSDYKWSVFALTAGTLDQASAGTGSGTAVSAGSLTTPSAGCYACSVAIMDDGGGFGGGWTAGSGWTILQNTGGGSWEQGSEYRTVVSAGSVTGDYTQSHSGTWVASLITFKP